LPSEQVFGFTG